jgi:hypothetical protein
MKAMKGMFLGLCLIAVFASLWLSLGVYGASVCKWKCEESGSCMNTVVITTSSAPRPEGCTKSGDNCTGDCYRCKNKSEINWCIYTGSSSDTCYYQTSDKILKCGDKYKYTCSGTWADNCTCASTGGSDTGNDCEKIKCNV